MAAETRFQDLLAPLAVLCNHFTAFGHLGCWAFISTLTNLIVFFSSGWGILFISPVYTDFFFILNPVVLNSLETQGRLITFLRADSLLDDKLKVLHTLPHIITVETGNSLPAMLTLLLFLP